MKKSQVRETPVGAPQEWHVDRVVLGLLIAGLVVFCIHHIIAYDFFWQLKTGQLVRAAGFPTTDPFSYGFPDRIWIEVRWLYCVTISIIYESFGASGLIAAKVPVLLLAGLCLWRFGRDDHRWVVNAGLFVALVLIHPRLMVRPELVTYVLLPAYLLLIRNFQLDGKIQWLLPIVPLQIIWVNSHTLYVLGPAVLWLFVGAELGARVIRLPFDPEADQRLSMVRIRDLAIAASAAALACLANPYGVRGALFALELFTETMGDEALNGLITELRSPFAAAGLTVIFVSYITVIVVSALGFILRRRSFSPGWLALWAAFLYLSVRAERNIALFGIIAAASIIVNYGRLDLARAVVWSVRSACAATLLVMIPLVVSNYFFRAEPDMKFGFGVAERRFPIKALEFVDSQKLPLPVMSNLAENSYVLYKHGPKSVYVDGRLEVYGPANVVAAVDMFSTGNDLLSTVEQKGVHTLIAHLDNDIALIQRLLQDTAWVPVYYDESHIIFLRTDASTDALAKRLKIDWQNPQPVVIPPVKGLSADGWLTNLFPSAGDNSSTRALGQLFLLTGNFSKAQGYLEDAVRRSPDDPRSCLHLGVLYRAQKRESEAASLHARVPGEMLNQLNNQIFSANTYEAFGNMEAAADAWLQVSRLGDTSTAVYQHLAMTSVPAQKWDAAYIAYDALSKRVPDDIQILNNLGTVADKVNKKQEALVALGRSLQLRPAQPVVATQIGIIKMTLGDAAGGRQAFEQALTADPSFEPARQHLEVLQRSQNR